MGKRSPDEFAVVKRAPLIVPPEFDLRPPDPGAPRPSVGRTSDRARNALTGSQDGPSQAAQILAGSTPPAADPNTLTSRGPTADVPGGVAASSVADQVLAAGTRSSVDGHATANAAATNAATTSTAATGGAAGPARMTAGEQAMVQMAGGDQADPEIRRTIAEENQTLADVETSLFTRIVDWRDPSSMGATVDAPAEAQRLRANKIEGRSPAEGDTPTVINRRQSALQGFLEDLF